MDCNIYLDVARRVGNPFRWDRFGQLVAQASRQPFPNVDPVVHSLMALAVCQSGRMAGDEPLEVWTNTHIDKIVRGKAMDPNKLGWPEPSATSLVTDLIHGLTSMSSGGTLGTHYPNSNPPLDHEDGMVYGACRELSSDDLLANVYCVTRDEGFLTAGREGRLDHHTRVLSPAEFVALVRAHRSRYSIRGMAPRNQ